MTTRMLCLGFIAAAVLATAGAALAQTDDKAFTYAMLQEAQGQITFAQLAQQRAQSDTTRALADRAYREWQAVQTRLGGIAFAHAYPTPGALSDAQVAVLNRLGQTQPEDFDIAYLQVLRRGIGVALTRMGDEDSTSDQDLSAFVGRTRPMFRQTRDMAGGQS